MLSKTFITHRCSTKDPPNKSQEEAIKTAFSKSTSIIWGPPGTGKTKTIARLVEAHINAGRRVLLVSHANTAVDEALENIAEHLKTTPFYQEGKLIRLGICHKKNLEDNYPLVILDKIAAKLGESMTSGKSLLLLERAKIVEILRNYQSFFDLQSKVDLLFKEITNLRRSIFDNRESIKIVNEEINRFEVSQLKNREKFSRALQAGMMQRLFGLDPK
ncbi:MAG TPA: hypothetical protein DCK76_11250 [Desulfotomaculum sp.]|nr:hypothetical protein [Desulfotomaculum sp.]